MLARPRIPLTRVELSRNHVGDGEAAVALGCVRL